MAKVSLQKVRITGLRGHYKILMQELHRWGLLEIIEKKEFIESSNQPGENFFAVFDLARLDFVLKSLAPYESKHDKADSFLSGGKLVMSEEEAKEKLKNFVPKSEDIISECEQIEEDLVRHKNHLHRIQKRKSIIAPYKLFHTPLLETFSTQTSETRIGAIRLLQKESFIETISNESHLVDLDVFGEEDGKFYFRITVSQEVAPRTLEILNSFGFEELDVQNEFSEFLNQKPREIHRSLEKEEKETEEQLQSLQSRREKLAVHLNDLRILYDYNVWRKKKNDLQYKILQTKNIFAFEAWMPERDYGKLEKWINDIFVGEVIMEQVDSEEGEVAPVYIQNKTGFASYEIVTEMFGTPGTRDIDPTSYLAPFFFVFFGLCLSDVGYGLILTFVSLFFLLFGTFSKSAKDGILLLLFCGIGATLGGIFVGGYFGMTAEQAPTFLLNSSYLAGVEGSLPFKGQFLDPMTGSGPITFLIFAIGLGMIQLLTGIFLDFVKRMKNKEYLDAFCDPLAWFFFLVVLCGFSVADIVGLPKELFKNLSLLGAGILVITQGRSQKNWFLKPISGVLGLYNITGYVSDLLSYSRIMALGLSTGVIGFAMNLTAGILGGMMPHPIVGFLVAVVFLLFGHGLNFALSVLGAFVHSGRLQFIEFFGKFFEGDGRKFKPFAREKKYLFFRNP